VRFLAVHAYIFYLFYIHTIYTFFAFYTQRTTIQSLKEEHQPDKEDSGNKKFLLPASGYAILDTGKGKAIEAALPTTLFLFTSAYAKASRHWCE